jgi:hypothetical protein
MLPEPLVMPLKHTIPLLSASLQSRINPKLKSLYLTRSLLHFLAYALNRPHLIFTYHFLAHLSSKLDLIATFFHAPCQFLHVKTA